MLFRSRYIAVTTYLGGFFLHDASSLAKLFVPQERYLQSSYRTRTQPAFFLESASGALEMLANGIHYKIALNAPGSAPSWDRAEAFRTYDDQPDAWDARSTNAFFVETPSTNDPYPLPFLFSRNFAGVVISPLDGSSVQQFISPRHDFNIDRLFFLPPTPTYPGGRVIAGGAEGVMVVDLTSRRYQWIKFNPFARARESSGGHTFQIAVSENGRVAACGSWGAAVWQLPE